jgi:hypothetical protein
VRGISDNGATFGSLLMLGNGTLIIGVKNQKEKNKPSFISLSPWLESHMFEVPRYHFCLVNRD